VTDLTVPRPKPTPGPPRPKPVNIHQSDRPRTWCAVRPNGGFNIGQGHNRVSLTRVEADRLIEEMSGACDLHYTTTTPR
jgi:hypothetical protein